MMAKLVAPHGSKELRPLLLTGQALADEKKKAAGLKKVPMTTRETSDLIMMAIGAFTPLTGFMGKDDWKGCCDDYQLPSAGKLFWPIPITLSADETLAGSIKDGEEVALWDTETDSLMGTMKVTEKYRIDKAHECQQVFRTQDEKHPGVEKVMAQGAVNLAGPVKATTETSYPERSTSGRRRPARSSRTAAGARWRPCSFATPCTGLTPTSRGSRSRSATASTSTSWWAS
jgi:sulfate adenylyltransferase